MSGVRHLDRHLFVLCSGALQPSRSKLLSMSCRDPPPPFKVQFSAFSGAEKEEHYCFGHQRDMNSEESERYRETIEREERRRDNHQHRAKHTDVVRN